MADEGVGMAAFIQMLGLSWRRCLGLPKYWKIRRVCDLCAAFTDMMPRKKPLCSRMEQRLVQGSLPSGIPREVESLSGQDCPPMLLFFLLLL